MSVPLSETPEDRFCRAEAHVISDHCDMSEKLLKRMLTLNAPIPTKVVCFPRLLKCLRCLYGKSVDPDQTAPLGAVCSVPTLFASILNSSVMLSNYLQQTTSAEDIFRYIFFLAL